ncbi:MAG TPA: YbaN family protein [Candidatus Pygmaiobacter gallistercoris]|nr:YbaN family protein [Candidatus Pygmaiobacter gallistercoris]
MKMKKLFWTALGCLGVVLGAVGAALPMLPAFPFLLLAAFSFGKSSERLYRWFTGTKLYRKNLESYLQGKGMTPAAKLRVMITVTLLMSVGFLLMYLRGLFLPCLILAGIWVFHLLYFALVVKTFRPETEPG